jgi:hypothetical protein
LSTVAIFSFDRTDQELAHSPPFFLLAELLPLLCHLVLPL